MKIILKNKLLIFLLTFVLLTRFFLLKDQVFSFTFDHGKDSLAVLDIWLNHDIKLIGPWTSIPGLYFGPAWYYLLLPAYIIGNGAPVYAIYLMTLLLLLQIYLAYRYLGKEEALIMATGITWLDISTSAWNPFPMTLISLLILILFKKIKEQRRASNWQLYLLALTASLGCHFSTAFAIFFPVLIFIFLFREKIALSFKQLSYMFLAYLMPFIPQLLFEIKHDFSEVRAILSYLQNSQGGDGFSIAKMLEIIKGYYEHLKMAATFDIFIENVTIKNMVNYAVLFYLLYFLKIIIFQKKKKHFFTLGKDSLIWVLLSFIAFNFLHYNQWYLLALAPLFVILIADCLRQSRKIVYYSFLALMFLTSISKVIYFIEVDRTRLAERRDFYPVKIKAINTAYALANNGQFSSYQYAPHIYDFDWQYLYFYQALQGRRLPIEFTYKSGEDSYIVQKKNLLEYFQVRGLVAEPTKSLKRVFLIEKAYNQDYLVQWWQSFSITDPGQLSKMDLSSELTVYYE